MMKIFSDPHCGSNCSRIFEGFSPCIFVYAHAKLFLFYPKHVRKKTIKFSHVFLAFSSCKIAPSIKKMRAQDARYKKMHASH